MQGTRGTSASRTRWRRSASTVALSVAIGSVLPVAAAAAAPSVAGTSTAAYTEQAAPTVIGSGVTISGGTAYDGNSVDFSVGGAASSESLSLGTDSAPDTGNGVVSVVGSSVYLGDGSSADVVGTVDTARNGQAGQPLRVTFGSAFANAGFETGDLSGWTAINQRIDLGVTSIAGHATTDTSTYPANVPNQDDNAPSSPGALSSTVQTSIVSEGTHALRLVSSGMTTAQGCDVVHGPAVYSSTFDASAGDNIYFDWRAYAGDDNFHVFGYIVDSAGNQTELLDATGGATNWATKQTTIPASGSYRFVFVSGTHDLSCGQAAGASLVIDNVRVFGARVDDAVVQQVARRLRYANTSDAPPASRTVTVSAASQSNGTGTGTITVAIAQVDDAPVLTSVPSSTFTNVETTQTFATVTGTLSSTDPEGDPVSYGVVGGVAAPATVGGTTYTHARTGTYGVLRVNAQTGAWAFVPDRGAIDARVTDDSESFQFTVSSGSLSGQQGYQVVIDVPDSNPGPPARPRGTAASERVLLSWDAPAWPGGSPTTSFRVESSADGVRWTTVGTTATTSYPVTGLTNGTPVQLRVTATNATGTGTSSAVVTATPFTVPGAPSVTTVVPGSRRLVVSSVPPVSDGGNAVTGYEYSVDGGATWQAGQVDPATRTLVIGGLHNGTAYPVVLRAVNQAGSGPASAPVLATPTPTPVPGAGSAAVPEVAPGKSQLLVDGVPQPVTLTVDGGVLTLTGDGFTAGLRAVDADGTRLRVDDEGRLVATSGGSVQVSGEGFSPGTTVDVWMFSTPKLLGEVMVGADGSFSRRLTLPAGIAVGPHTVQMNGISTDGQLRSLSTGIVVEAEGSALAHELAYTGSSPLPLVGLALALLLTGIVALLLGRRRTAVQS